MSTDNPSTIDNLREELLGTLADLRRKENPMEPDRARAIAQVASVIVDSARVEVDYLKVVDGTSSAFLGDASKAKPAGLESKADPLRIREHRIR